MPPERFAASRADLPHPVLQLAEDLLDQVRVGAIGRQEQRAGADVPDRLAPPRPCAPEIAHDDDVAGLERRSRGRVPNLLFPRGAVGRSSAGRKGGMPQPRSRRRGAETRRRRSTPRRRGTVEARPTGRDASCQMGRAPCHRMPYPKQPPGQNPHDRPLTARPDHETNSRGRPPRRPPGRFAALSCGTADDPGGNGRSGRSIFGDNVPVSNLGRARRRLTESRHMLDWPDHPIRRGPAR